MWMKGPDAVLEGVELSFSTWKVNQLIFRHQSDAVFEVSGSWL